MVNKRVVRILLSGLNYIDSLDESKSRCRLLGTLVNGYFRFFSLAHGLGPSKFNWISPLPTGDAINH